MIFFLGIIFFVIGIGLMIKLFVSNRRPKAQAVVKGLFKEVPPGQYIQLPHALVEYDVQGTRYTAKVVVRGKPEVGGSIQVAVKPQNPTQIVEYNPKAEIVTSLLLTGAGIVLIVVSAVVSGMV